MTTLMDVLGVDLSTLLTTYVAGGWLRQQWHPTEPLAILNYTEKATFDKKWDRVTLNCRGLIYNTDTLEIVARPFPKFFNSTEEPAAKFSLEEKVIVTDKMDGSLGIIYREPSTGRAAVATRGSFMSEQAVHATNLLRDKYSDWLTIYETIAQNDVQVTLLVEIVFPENRIVLDYEGLNDLVLLGGVTVFDGTILNPAMARVVYGWPGPKTHTFGFMTYADALAMPPRENAEGVVIRGAEDNRMVKLKQEDYIRLHRIITGLNARAVWDHMRNNSFKTDSLKESLPEEFWGFVDEVAETLINQMENRFRDLFEDYRGFIAEDHPNHPERAAFAMRVLRHPDKWAMFAFLDGDDDRVWSKLFYDLKPEAGWTPHQG